MATNSAIEWTEVTWNPVTGCSKISKGCKNCYAERMAHRLHAMGMKRYENGFKVSLHPDLLSLPYTWKAPRKIFVNSMSDLFHDDVPEPYIREVFAVMRKCERHQFQILTKRSDRLRRLAHALTWPPNVWMGVSVENQQTLRRIRDLVQVPAQVRFLSLEPLLEDLGAITLADIHWVIVGGESGPRARWMDPDWVDSIFRQCKTANVPFFFKQWGGPRKDLTGRELYGRTYDELPVLN